MGRWQSTQGSLSSSQWMDRTFCDFLRMATTTAPAGLVRAVPLGQQSETNCRSTRHLETLRPCYEKDGPLFWKLLGFATKTHMRLHHLDFGEALVHRAAV